MSHVDLLRSIPMFHGLSDEDLGALVAAVSERHFSAGGTIISQGEPGTEMFIVAAGQVNVFLAGEASPRLSLKDIARGEYFG
jgi:CRP/FNR family cyclic AMP-dependent transcriptional regulator